MDVEMTPKKRHGELGSLEILTRLKMSKNTTFSDEVWTRIGQNTFPAKSKNPKIKT